MNAALTLRTPLFVQILLSMTLNFTSRQPLQMHGESEANVRAVTMVKSGAFYVLGADDGSIRVHNSADFQRSFSLPVHDNNYGRVLRVASSFDNSHLLTIGADGNFFVFTAAYSGEPEPVCFQSMLVFLQLNLHFKVGTGRLQAASKISPAEDIVDPKAYSIEETKQKAAFDKKMKTAEQKKMDDRRLIRKLRTEFEQLLAEVRPPLRYAVSTYAFV